MFRSPRAILLAALLTTSGLLAACGDDGDDVAADDPAASSTTATTAAPGNGLGIEGGSAGPDAIEVTGTIDEKPTIALNDAGAVTELYTEDVILGAGPVAGSTDEVEVQYVGQQLDGVQFDASWDRGSPAVFGLDGGVIPGFAQGITGMAVGSRRLLVIPEELAYAGGEPAGTLVFVVDLVSITQDNADPLDPVGDGSGVITVTGEPGSRPVLALNGALPAIELVTEDIIEGEGAEVVAGSTVTVQYSGYLLDGTVFDETWDDGQAVTVALDRVIDGWEQGIPGMHAGGRRLLVIPAALAYGAAGNGPIGPDQTLVFVVDVVEVVS